MIFRQTFLFDNNFIFVKRKNTESSILYINAILATKMYCDFFDVKYVYYGLKIMRDFENYPVLTYSSLLVIRGRWFGSLFSQNRRNIWIINNLQNDVRKNIIESIELVPG